MPPKAKEILAPKEQATFRQILVNLLHTLNALADRFIEKLRTKTIQKRPQSM